jgi:hypothetical protein
VESVVTAELGFIALFESAAECLLLVNVHTVAQLLVD